MGRPRIDSRWLAWLGPCAIAAAFAALAAWSWEKWADAHIDFGNELYVAWQLVEGKALYRDIAYRNGPLSHHLNALWFALFGVSIRTLALCNLAILAGLCAMIHRIFLRSCGRLTATVTGLVFLGVFAFSQYTGIASFNYVAPYQHGQTHGLVLSIAMILAFGAALRRASAAWSALAGACLGAVCLTKAELAVPALATAAAGGFLVLGSLDRGRARLALCFGAAALLPAVGFFAGLRAQMSSAQALTGVLGNWAYLGGDVWADRFYAAGAGFTDPWRNLGRALAMFAAIAGFAGLALAADRLLPAIRGRAAWSAGAGLALFALLALHDAWVPWPELARALPAISGVAAAALVLRARRLRGDREALARALPLALWSVLSFFLLGKILLHARFGQYGFALAMPATLLLVAALLELPGVVLARAPGRGGLARALALAALAAGVLFFLRWSDDLYARKTVAIGRGADRILADASRGRLVALALERLGELMPPDATLLPLPEGVALNYWLRRESPSRYYLFLPPELRAHGGEEAILEDLRARPPDFVALVHRRHEEFGVGPFGADPDNGERIVAWVEANYRRVARVGAEPFRGRRFGIAILERGDGSR